MPAVAAAPVSVRRVCCKVSQKQLRNNVAMAWVETAAVVCDLWLWGVSPAATGRWASVAVSVVQLTAGVCWASGRGAGKCVVLFSSAQPAGLCLWLLCCYWCALTLLLRDLLGMFPCKGPAGISDEGLCSAGPPGVY